MNRQEFLGSAATVAHICCGKLGLREMGDLLQNPKFRVVAVCDSNKYSTDYIDWPPYGIRDDIRKTHGDDTRWSDSKGIAGGKETPDEGLMLVGTKEELLGGFRGQNLVLLAESRRTANRDSKRINSLEADLNMASWAEKIVEGKQTPGSFIRAQTITDKINLGTVALRAGKKVDFDTSLIKVTNYP